MKPHESKTLKVGDRVRWRKNGKTKGVVSEIRTEVVVLWDDGLEGQFDHSEMGPIWRADEVPTVQK